MTCCVYKCTNSSRMKDKGLSFYAIPTFSYLKRNIDLLKNEQRNRWLLAVNRKDFTEQKIKNARICSKHFLSGKPANTRDVDNPDWVPTQHMGYEKKTPKEAVARYQRVTQRRLKKQTDAAAEEAYSEPTTEVPTNINDISPIQNVRDIGFSSEQEVPPNNNDNLIIKKLDQDIVELKLKMQMQALEITERLSESIQLRSKVVSLSLSEESFIDNDEKTKFYTGLPSFKTLKAIAVYIDPFLPKRFVLTNFEQLLLTLMKLRLNLLFTDLGYRFNIDRRTCSRCFYKCLDIMYKRLTKKLIMWPTRETLISTMPKCFRDVFGNKKIAVIIDCFEIFSEKPSRIDAASQLFSTYKHHHTIKFLIGICPQGGIVFISSPFGGRASDKYITEKSGILLSLLPGDVVLADRGFLITDSVNLHMAELLTPAFLKGQNQLNPIDVEKTRKIATVRIHVERVIGQLKSKFTIMSKVMPMYILNQYENEEIIHCDKIANVCAALLNLCPSVVPQ